MVITILKRLSNEGGETVQTITDTIDQKIAFFMFEQKLTVEKMAGLLGMTPNTLRAKRSGKTEWTLGEMMELSDLFGMTLDEIAGLK